MALNASGLTFADLNSMKVESDDIIIEK